MTRGILRAVVADVGTWIGVLDRTSTADASLKDSVSTGTVVVRLYIAVDAVSGCFGANNDVVVTGFYYCRVWL